MTLRDSSLIAAWIAIPLLTLGVAGLLRAIYILSTRVDQLTASRHLVVRPGDQVRVPSIIERQNDTVPLLVLFGSGTCVDCERAHLAFRGNFLDSPDVEFVSIWSDDGPPEIGEESIPRQPAAFEALGIGYVPFFLLVHQTRVLASGEVSTPQSLSAAITAINATAARSSVGAMDPTLQGLEQ